MSCSRTFEAEYSITKQHMSICFSFFGSLIDIDNEFDCKLSSIYRIKVRHHKFDYGSGNVMIEQPFFHIVICITLTI